MVAVLGIGNEITAIEADRGVSFAKDEGVRFEHRDVLFPLVAQKVSGWPYAQLKAALDDVGGCYGPYQTMLDAARNPELVGNNPIFGTANNPSGAAYPAAGSFATLPGQDRQPPAPAPYLGAHSEEILATRLGLGSGAIAKLIDTGIVGVHG